MKRIENLYVNSRTEAMWNVIRHVRSSTSSSDSRNKEKSRVKMNNSCVQQCTSAAQSKYSKPEYLVMDKMYCTEEGLARFMKSLKSGCGGGQDGIGIFGTTNSQRE